MAGMSGHERAPDPSPALPPAASVRPEEADSGQWPASAPRTALATRVLAITFVRQVIVIAAPIITYALFLVLAIAPVAALLAALWASGSALVSLARLVMLIQAGQALSSPATPALLGALDTAARAGFLAIDYLALIFALITLMAGLFGRGWGRLFVLPGAVFSVTALALMVIGALVAAPLANELSMPAAWLVPLMLYALIDAALVSAVFVDLRQTRSPSATGRHRAARQRRAAPQAPRESGPAPAREDGSPRETAQERS